MRNYIIIAAFLVIQIELNALQYLKLNHINKLASPKLS